jgi:viroplasmin and RNaseH domain-containing protein
MNEEVQPSVESNTRFKDVKGAYSPKAKLKEIVEYLRDPEVDFPWHNNSQEIILLLRIIIHRLYIKLVMYSLDYI